MVARDMTWHHNPRAVNVFVNCPPPDDCPLLRPPDHYVNKEFNRQFASNAIEMDELGHSFTQKKREAMENCLPAKGTINFIRLLGR